MSLWTSKGTFRVPQPNYVPLWKTTSQGPSTFGYSRGKALPRLPPGIAKGGWCLGSWFFRGVNPYPRGKSKSDVFSTPEGDQRGKRLLPWKIKVELFFYPRGRPKGSLFFYPFENPYPPEMLPKPAGKSHEGSEGRQRATRVGPETPPGFFPRVPV